MLVNIDNAQNLTSRSEVLQVMAAKLKISCIAEFTNRREELNNRQRMMDGVLLVLSPDPDERQGRMKCSAGSIFESSRSVFTTRAFMSQMEHGYDIIPRERCPLFYI